MLAAPAGSRLLHYIEKLNPERVEQVLTVRKAKMVEYYGTWAPIQADLYPDIIVVLNDEGVPTIQWLDYYNFTFRVDRLKRMTGEGTPFQNEALVLRDRWVALGLDEGVLDHLLTDIFGFTPP
jgi:hypothetical protein